MDIGRRSLLKGGAAVAAGTACTTLPTAKADPLDRRSDCPASSGADELKATAIYVPGYYPNKAQADGRGLMDLPGFARGIKASDKHVRLISRIGMDGSIRQSLLPAAAHDVEIAPDRSIGLLCGFAYGGHVAFDPNTLDIVGRGKPVKKGWIGGGHATFLADSKTVLISERAPQRSLRYKVESHYGRITVREPESLKILETHSTHGIDPHDISLVEDGRYLVIANYGSVIDKTTGKMTAPRRVVEASVTVIETSSGKLVDKHITNTEHTELRHLAAKDQGAIFAIQALTYNEETGMAADATHGAAYPVGLVSQPPSNYLAAETLRLSGTGGREPMGNEQTTTLMRQGLSIKYDARHDQVIATYPSTHRVMVFDASSGDIVQIVDTSTMGLRYPCGLTFLPGEKFYAVTGYWENLFVFERQTHRLVRDLCLYPVFFGHSHICAA